MATNHGDLVQMLIEGGLAPQASWVIANAIANAASGTFSKGNDTTDATPTEALRLITPDTRRYRLTNLDYSPSDPFQDRISSKPGRYENTSADHPYKDSQPISTAPPLSSPRVQGGNYVGVENLVEGTAAISRVDLKLRAEQGRHLRLDPSTKSLDAIAWTAFSESPKVLGCEVREGEQGTEIVISLRNLAEVTLLLANGDSRKALVFPQASATGPASYAAGGTRSLSEKNIRLENGKSQNVLLWTTGNEVDGPAAPPTPAAICKAWAVFNGTLTSPITPIASSNVTNITRPASTNGVFQINLASGAVSGSNYLVLGTSSVGAAGNDRVLALRSDLTVNTSQFTVQVTDGAGAAASGGTARVSVAVFE